MESLVLSGQPSIIIRCGCDFKLNNIEFKKGQLIAVVNDCNTRFTYKTKQTTIGRGAGTLASTEEVALSEIYITSVPFNQMLYTLVFNKQDVEMWRPNIINAIPQNNKVVLATTELIHNVEVYDENYQPLLFEFDPENNIITVNTNKMVRVSYYSKLNNGMSMSAIGNKLPYFTIECISKGNSIGEDRIPILQYMYLHKCALKLDPFFLFNDSITNFDLAFNIIQDKEDKIEYGNER